MDKEKLKEMAGDERFIKGIYNYCDRWCERCPQTSRCLNYAMSKEEFAEPETMDLRNEEFWKHLSGIFQDTLELLKEKAAQEGIDLDALDLDESEEESRAIREAAGNHEVTRAARLYIDMAEDWLDGVDDLPGLPPHHQDMEGPEAWSLEEALEVIRWYQHLIYTKLMRAVSSRMEEETEEADDPFEYARDSDGSAKVALIGIDRSIAAWSIIDRRFPSFRGREVPAVLAHLERLRRGVERSFPDARSFIRPGFDRIDLND